MKYLDNNLYKIDADIPISMMSIGKNDQLNRAMEDAWNRLKDTLIKRGVYGGINVLISPDGSYCEDHINSAAFMVCEMSGRLHRHTRKSKGWLITAEMGIKLLDTRLGNILLNHAINLGDFHKLDFYLRGLLTMEEHVGTIKFVEFKEVTAVIKSAGDYKQGINEIFNSNLLGYCSAETIDVIEERMNLNTAQKNTKINDFTNQSMDHWWQ